MADTQYAPVRAMNLVMYAVAINWEQEGFLDRKFYYSNVKAIFSVPNVQNKNDKNHLGLEFLAGLAQGWVMKRCGCQRPPR